MGKRFVGHSLFAPIVLCFASAAALAQQTTRVSVDSSGNQGNSDSRFCDLGPNGRLVMFQSNASNLVTGDTNASTDLFVYDRRTGLIERVSVDSSGNQGNASSTNGYGKSMAIDGLYVAFVSSATNLVSSDTNARVDVFGHDRTTAVTERLNVDSSGNQANGDSVYFAVSGDGSLVAFDSLATNLVSGDTNAVSDVFFRDRTLGTTTRISVDSSGNQGNGDSTFPAASSDGRFVAFVSLASNLVSGDTNGVADVFVHDRQTGTTERVSIDSSGNQGNNSSLEPSISADGRFVTFDSLATNLVTGDTNGTSDVFVHDRSNGTTTRTSVSSTGAQGNGDSFSYSISQDGRFTALRSSASNLVSGDTNGFYDVFVHDAQTGVTTRVNVDSSGAQANSDTGAPSVSADGRLTAFRSDATNLVPGDTNGTTDVFVHGRFLTFEATPDVVTAGSTLTLSSWYGMPNGLTMLVLVGVNGSATFQPLLIGSFDGTGLWTIAGTVPAGFSGLQITLQSYGIVPTGKVDSSNPADVTFQ